MVCSWRLCHFIDASLIDTAIFFANRIFPIFVQLPSNIAMITYTVYAAVSTAIWRESTGWCVAYPYMGVIRCFTPSVCPSVRPVCLSYAHDFLEIYKLQFSQGIIHDTSN